MNAILAKVNGEALTEFPSDLYIPPDALEVFLATFEGPLDLLLYLIRRQNLDIVQISVAQVTEQYLRYISMMTALRLELAGEYLVMAATLAEIKSRLLLPVVPVAGEEESDPRALLLKRLLEYERFKKAAQTMDTFSWLERDVFTVEPMLPPLSYTRPLPSVNLKELLVAFSEAIERAEMFTKHAVTKELLSVEERMTRILARLKEEASILFMDCFDLKEGRGGVVVSFLAILELVKTALIWVSQPTAFGMIYVSLPSVVHNAPELEMAAS